MAGLLALIVALFTLIFGIGGLGGWAAVESTEVEAVPIEEATMVITMVERSENVTNVDRDGDGPSPGDMIVWGPDPLYDETNTVDTGAVTYGTCVMVNDEGDCMANMTILFPDGSAIQIQGLEPGATVTSVKTIVGGTGEYAGATGTLIDDPSPDRSTWTKTLEISY
jgi:hypothetical protein